MGKKCAGFSPPLGKSEVLFRESCDGNSRWGPGAVKPTRQRTAHPGGHTRKCCRWIPSLPLSPRKLDRGGCPSEKRCPLLPQPLLSTSGCGQEGTVFGSSHSSRSLWLSGKASTIQAAWDQQDLSQRAFPPQALQKNLVESGTPGDGSVPDTQRPAFFLPEEHSTLRT